MGRYVSAIIFEFSAQNKGASLLGIVIAMLSSQVVCES